MRAAIFDFDGVLVDSEPLHFRALAESLLEEGLAIDEDEYRGFFVGREDRSAIRLALERHGKTSDPAARQAIAQRKADRFRRLLGEITFLPGAKSLVMALAKEMPVAIASGARREEIEGILEAGSFREPFHVIVGAEDVAHSKPDPEPFLLAARRLREVLPDLAPAECVVFEDSVPGVAAGRAAGMKVVAVTNSHPAEKLGAAHRVVPTLQGLTVSGLRSLLEG